MSFIKIDIHFVWSTKNRHPFLDTLPVREKMWGHIKQNATKQEIFIDCINGHCDHCHCIISLAHNQTISKIAQLLKGESAHWMNQQGLIAQKFGWQDEYYAAAVSESNLNALRKYIFDQEEHHKKISFKNEIERMILVCGLKEIKDPK